MLAATPAAQAISGKQAERRALKALGVERGDDPVIVFRLDRTLPAGARITEAGTRRRPRGGRVFADTGAVVARMPALRRLRLRGERAYFFYADLGPFQTYQHPGRVALVGRRSGRVRVSERLMWPPLIDGRLPAFMRSAEAYHDRRGWALYRPWREDATAGAAINRGPIGLPQLDPPLVDVGLRRRAADLLAAERSCVVRFSDTLGHFYDFGAVDRTRGWLGAEFTRLEDLNPGFTDVRYVRSAGVTPMKFVEDVIADRGCRDVLVYLAGGAWSAGGSAVSVGIRPVDSRRILQQFITVGQLRSLLRAHRDLTFKIVADAPYSGRLADTLIREGNALIVATPGGSRARTFSYLPEVELPGGRLRRHPGNPHGLLEFTNRALFGLERFLASRAEVEHAAAELAAGRSPSFLAWMLARAFALGAGEQLVGRLPRVDTPFTPTPPPVATNRPPTAAGAARSTDEDVPVAIALTASDPDGDPLTYSIVAGPAHGTLTGSGAQRTYTPARDFNGADGFTFRVADGRGGMAEARVTIQVNPVNDAPVITTSAGSAAFIEGDPPVAVDPALTVADVDDAVLHGATVSIASVAAADELLFTDQSGIAGSYDAATGTLTLAGAASVADYQAALRTVAYGHTGDDPPAVRTVAFRASDAAGPGPAATRNVAVTPVNDAPTVATSSGSAAFTEGGGPVPVDPAVAVADPDSAFLTGATIDLGSSFIVGEDVLGFTDQSGITGSYNAGTGLLTLSGIATVASYQAALRSVTYDNTSTNPSTATRTVSVQVTDIGGAASNTADRNVTVAAANDQPVITTTAAPLAYTEGDPATAVDAGLTVSDPDDTDLEGATVRISAGFEAGDELLFADQSGIAGSFDAGTGVLTLAGTSSVANYQTALRSVAYRHTGDDPATSKTVEFRGDDGDGLGAPATRDIAVTPVNDAPQIATTGTDLAYTENDGPVAIDAGLTVADPDSAQLQGATVSVTSGFAPAQDELGFADQLGITGAYDDVSGVLALSGNASVADYQSALRSVTYENVSDGPDPLARTITFQATDDGGATSNAAARDIVITSVNDPPVAVDDTGTTDEDTPLTVAAPGVLANDTDPDAGDTKTVVALNGSPTLTGTSVAGATVTIGADGSYAYDPGSVFQGLNDGESDSDSFTYTMADGGGAQSTATVNLTITGVSDAPTAAADSFDAIGNTALFAGTTRPAGEAGKATTGSVLDNDTDPDTPQASLVAEEVVNAPTALGGTITIEADGNFAYHPDDGDTGVTDTFTYRVCDTSPCTAGSVRSSTGTLSLPIAGQVWYVRNNAAAGGDGTSDGHFDTLAEAEAASSTGDTVYVFDGDDTATGLDTGYAMEANERLIGEHSGLSLDPDGGGPLGLEALHAGTAGAHPTLAASDEDVVTLAAGTTVSGFNVDPAGTGGGISGGAGTSGVTIADVNVTDGGTAGTQPGLELDGTSGTNNVSDLTVSTSGATGVRLNNAGTVNFAPAGTIAIAAAGAKGLDASGTNMGASTFDAITVTGSGSGGVSMANTTGATTFGDLSLTTTSGTAPAFQLSSAGTVTVPAAGTANVSATGGPAVDVTGTSGAALAFDSVSSTNSAGDGINLAGLGAGTFSATGGTIAGAAGIAFDLDGGSGAVTYPGALGNGAGETAEITGRSGGAVTLGGAVSDGADAGGGISLAGNTGGSTTFGNPSKVLNTTTSSAVSFTSSDGHTLNLTGGGLDVDTTTGQGVVATNSGTLVVSGAGNTITSTTGRALNVVNTDLGGATFQSISSNGAVNGINLSNTGASAGLTVTGGGSSAQGGDGSGGTIQNTTGPAISLASTQSPSFRNMTLQNTGDSAVNGTQVNGFSFTDGTITGAGDADDENSITFDDSLTGANVSGAVTITNNVISQTEAGGVDIQNGAGTITHANVSGNALSDTGDVATPGSAVSIVALGSASTVANITRATLANNTIADFRAGAGFQVRGGNATAGGPPGTVGVPGSGTNVIAITGNSMNGGSGGVGNQPDRFVTASVTGGGQGNFDVSANGTAGNRIRNIDCIAIELQADGPVTAASTVQSNFINANSAVGCAGIAVGTDDPAGLGAGTHTTTIANNNVMGTDGPGIFPIVRASGSTMTARVVNNTVAAPITTNAARAGIRVDSGSAVGDTTLCLEIAGNTTAGSTNTATATTSPGINLRKQGTDPTVNTFGIEGLSPSPTGTPNVENWVNSQNTSSSGNFGVGGTALLSATAGFTSCVAP